MPRIPKREEERVRREEPPLGAARHGTMRPVKDKRVTAAERREWHPLAVRLFEALRESGQSDFYQESDWVVIRMMCLEYSLYLENPHARGSAMRMQNIQKFLSSLGVTEGDRRSVLRLELDRDESEVEQTDGRKRRLAKQAEAQGKVVEINAMRA